MQFGDSHTCFMKKVRISPHLTEQLAGHRNFATGTIGEVIRGAVSVSADTSIIYSPFGMGILDLAMGRILLKTALEEKNAIEIPEFSGDVSRW